MNRLLSAAMLLAALATAFVGILEHAQLRHLEYEVARLERRRIAAERRIQRLASAAMAARAPRTLLAEREDVAQAAEALAHPAADEPWLADDLAPDVSLSEPSWFEGASSPGGAR